MKLTLDTNCIIDVAESRPAAQHILDLVHAHKTGVIDVAVTAVSASERQPGGQGLQHFGEFQERLAGLGLGGLNLLMPLQYWGVTFWGYAVWASREMVALEEKIHHVLFPTIEYHWTEYCAKHNLDPEAGLDKKWRNAKCDVLSMWCHIHYKRDIFVTSDGNFHKPSKRQALIALGAGRIEFPESALLLVQNSHE